MPTPEKIVASFKEKNPNFLSLLAIASDDEIDKAFKEFKSSNPDFKKLTGHDFIQVILQAYFSNLPLDRAKEIANVSFILMTIANQEISIAPKGDAGDAKESKREALPIQWNENFLLAYLHYLLEFDLKKTPTTEKNAKERLFTDQQIKNYINFLLKEKQYAALLIAGNLLFLTPFSTLSTQQERMSLAILCFSISTPKQEDQNLKKSMYGKLLFIDEKDSKGIQKISLAKIFDLASPEVLVDLFQNSSLLRELNLQATQHSGAANELGELYLFYGLKIKDPDLLERGINNLIKAVIDFDPPHPLALNRLLQIQEYKPGNLDEESEIKDAAENERVKNLMKPIELILQLKKIFYSGLDDEEDIIHQKLGRESKEKADEDITPDEKTKKYSDRALRREKGEKIRKELRVKATVDQFVKSVFESSGATPVQFSYALKFILALYQNELEFRPVILQELIKLLLAKISLRKDTDISGREIWIEDKDAKIGENIPTITPLMMRELCRVADIRQLIKAVFNNEEISKEFKIAFLKFYFDNEASLTPDDSWIMEMIGSLGYDPPLNFLNQEKLNSIQILSFLNLYLSTADVDDKLLLTLCNLINEKIFTIKEVASLLIPHLDRIDLTKHIDILYHLLEARPDYYAIITDLIVELITHANIAYAEHIVASAIKDEVENRQPKNFIQLLQREYYLCPEKIFYACLNRLPQLTADSQNVCQRWATKKGEDFIYYTFLLKHQFLVEKEFFKRFRVSDFSDEDFSKIQEDHPYLIPQIQYAQSLLGLPEALLKAKETEREKLLKDYFSITELSASSRTISQNIVDRGDQKPSQQLEQKVALTLNVDQLVERILSREEALRHATGGKIFLNILKNMCDALLRACQVITKTPIALRLTQLNIIRRSDQLQSLKKLHSEGYQQLTALMVKQYDTMQKNLEKGRDLILKRTDLSPMDRALAFLNNELLILDARIGKATFDTSFFKDSGLDKIREKIDTLQKECADQKNDYDYCARTSQHDSMAANLSNVEHFFHQSSIDIDNYEMKRRLVQYQNSLQKEREEFQRIHSIPVLRR